MSETPSDRYWREKCPRCGHDRGWHGEGGCHADRPTLAAILLGLAKQPRRCGCRVVAW